MDMKIYNAIRKADKESKKQDEKKPRKVQNGGMNTIGVMLAGSLLNANGTVK